MAPLVGRVRVVPALVATLKKKQNWVPTGLLDSGRPVRTLTKEKALTVPRAANPPTALWPLLTSLESLGIWLPTAGHVLVVAQSWNRTVPVARLLLIQILPSIDALFCRLNAIATLTPIADCVVLVNVLEPTAGDVIWVALREQRRLVLVQVPVLGPGMPHPTMAAPRAISAISNAAFALIIV